MGILREEWESTFAPAKIVLFDSDSAMLEHFVWIWTEGSSVITGLK